MKINKRLIRKSVLTIAAFGLIGLGVSCTDIWSEQHPGTYYTNNGETIADYLDGRVQDHGNYSYFIAILQKAELWGQMRTYGTYTCFAPNDSAIQQYIDDRREEAVGDSMKQIFQSIETVLQNRKLCDTLARTHLFNNAMYASDLNGNGVLQHPNMLDRYVTYYSYADSSQIVYDEDGNPLKAYDGTDSVMVRLKYLINMQATLIKSDDSVQNGVVHKIDKVIRPSNQFLPGLMKENPNLSIFYSALVNTRLIYSMQDVYIDETYPEIEYEWTEQALRDGYSGIHKNETSVETGDNADRIAYPEKREFKFTMFCMPDTALENYADDYTVMAGLDGIHNLADLRKYAETAYPEGAGQPDSLKTSSLYKFLAYHILPCWLSYDQFNTSQKEIIKRHLYLKEHDIEDFFATMLPHSIMRISTPYVSNDKALGIYINRRGTTSTGLIAEGVRIAQDASEYNLPGSLTNICVNGGYHYINKLLVYDDFTRNTALQCRMRIMCCTLSPDFINSRGRGRLNGDPTNAGIKNIDKMVMAYKLGYCDNFLWVEDQTRFYVRYRDKGFGTYNGDELTVRGSYDLAFKLPPVPADGTYEIRAWNNSLAGSANNDRGVVQFYIHQYNPAVDAGIFWRNWDWKPQGIPVDLRIGGDDARIGMVSDTDTRYDGMTTAQKKNAIYQNDRAMRIRGYLKAPDSYTNSSSSDNSGDPIRVSTSCYRKIICNEYLKADNDYWIRMRQVFEDDGVFPFSFIEIVPKSIYEGNEDQH
ncbi:MAG: fasciclin domain-containing protein [Bacteroidaceae bacterium]|nr:fasciclin domain-containing protein [Bacteroidaceae bacterium]